MNPASLRLALVVAYLVFTEFRSCSSLIAFRTNTLEAKWLWHSSNVSSMLVCFLTCMNDLNCKVIGFSPSKRTCRGYPRHLNYYRTHSNDTKEGETILVSTCTVSGSPCTHNDECHFEKSVCFTGMCMCKPGFYYSPRSNICQKECSEYGQGMDVYEQLSIRRHNNKYMGKVSLTTCKQLCVHETAFRCLTFEFFPRYGHCGLSKTGYLDVKVGHRETGQLGWALGQRQCK